MESTRLVWYSTVFHMAQKNLYSILETVLNYNYLSEFNLLLMCGNKELFHATSIIMKLILKSFVDVAVIILF